MTKTGRIALATLLACLGACGDDSSPDSGQTDSGQADSGRPDSDTTDSGRGDSATPVDSGSGDVNIGEDARADGIVDLCEGVSCGPTDACDPASGECVSICALIICELPQVCDVGARRCVGPVMRTQGTGSFEVTLPDDGRCLTDARVDTKRFWPDVAFDIETETERELDIREGNEGVCCNQEDLSGNQLPSTETITEGLYLRGECRGNTGTLINAELRAFYGERVEEDELTDEPIDVSHTACALRHEGSPPASLRDINPEARVVRECEGSPMWDFPVAQYGAYSQTRLGCRTRPDNPITFCGSETCDPTFGADPWCSGPQSGGGSIGSVCVENNTICNGNRDNDVHLNGGLGDFDSCDGPIDYAFRINATEPFGEHKLLVMRLDGLPHCERFAGLPAPSVEYGFEYITWDRRAELGRAPFPPPPASPLAIGDEHHGGTVAYLSDDGEHGILAEPYRGGFDDTVEFECRGDLAAAQSRLPERFDNGLDEGYQATAAIVSTCAPAAVNPATFCANLIVDGNGDWALPTQAELSRVYGTYRSGLQNEEFPLRRGYFGFFGSMPVWTSNLSPGGAVTQSLLTQPRGDLSAGELEDLMRAMEDYGIVRCVSVF